MIAMELPVNNISSQALADQLREAVRQEGQARALKLPTADAQTKTKTCAKARAASGLWAPAVNANKTMNS